MVYPANLYEEIGKSVLQGFSQGVHRIEANPRQVWIWKLETSDVSSFDLQDNNQHTPETSDVMMCVVKKKNLSWIYQLYPSISHGIPIIWSHITVVSHGIPWKKWSVPISSPFPIFGSRRVVSTRDAPPLHRSTVAVPDPPWPGWMHGMWKWNERVMFRSKVLWTIPYPICICNLYTVYTIYNLYTVYIRHVWNQSVKWIRSIIKFF